MTAPVTLILRPHDTLFLRDGRPFNQGDQEQAATAGIFPPYPPTMVGAMRAALARASGWRPKQPWPAGLGDGVDWAKGDGPLEPLRFMGPFVLQDGKPLFPAPHCLLVKRSGEAIEAVVRLAPGAPLDCDLGRVAMPTPVRRLEGGKAPEGVWIDGDGLKALLDWVDPKRESLIQQNALWKTEARVGIARTETRTTGEGALYATAHIRPEKDVAVAVSVDGTDISGMIGKLTPVGGEGRGVWIESNAATIELPPPPDLEPDHDGVLRYTVVLLTPAFFGDAEEDWPKPDGTIRDGAGFALPGRIVSACVGKPVPVGGWDGEARAPLALRPLAPAGSVIFLDALPVEPVVLDADVMTPHFGAWYQEAKAPGDWHSPTPIPFLTVAPGQPFQFALLPRTPADKADCETAATRLKDALQTLGAGAKTAVGYGQFGPPVNAETEPEASPDRVPNAPGKAPARLPSGTLVEAKLIEKNKKDKWRALHEESGVIATVEGSPPEGCDVGAVYELLCTSGTNLKWPTDEDRQRLATPPRRPGGKPAGKGRGKGRR